MKRHGILIGAILALFGCATPMQMGTAFQSDRISIVTRGSGPDVVLIPGLTSSPEIWEESAAALPGYRYHFVQLAGFAGAPAGANATDGPILPAVAEEIARYIAQARLDQPALVGHSMGGSLAMMVAARHPDSVSKLMVVDMLPFVGAMFGPPGTTADSLKPTADAIQAASLARTSDQRKAYVETTIAGMIKTEAKRAAPVRHGLTSDPVVGARAFHELILTDLRPELAAIRAPMTVLYVRGPNIPLTDAQMDAVYQASFANTPAASLKRIPDSYHFIMIDQPAAFQNELRAFLTR